MAQNDSPLSPTALFQDCDEDSITIKWIGQAGNCYRVEYKEYSQDWDDCQSILIPMTLPSIPSSLFLSQRLTGLQPKTIYMIRIVSISGNVEQPPGTVLIIDTQAPHFPLLETIFEKCQEIASHIPNPFHLCQSANAQSELI